MNNLHVCYFVNHSERSPEVFKLQSKKTYQIVTVSSDSIGRGFKPNTYKSGIIISSNCCCCSVAKLCLTLCNSMDCSMPGSSVLHYLPEFAQIHVHWVGDAIKSSHPLPSPFVFNLFFPASGSFPMNQLFTDPTADFCFKIFFCCFDCFHRNASSWIPDCLYSLGLFGEATCITTS